VKAVGGRPQQKLPFPEDTDLFSLFQISLANYFDIKFRLWEEFKLSIENIENLPYYEYQLFIDKLNEKIERENKKIEQGDLVEAFSFSKPKR
jgi:hypothetical protein